MHSIIWTIGSMMVLVLIITLLPLGFTKNGKIFVVLVSYMLALGGIAAVASFPLWQTFLLLLALSFFASYILHSRMGKIMYKEQTVVEDYIVELEFDVSTIKKENDEELDLLVLNELETAPVPVLNLDKKNRQTYINQININSNPFEDEDISFLQDRNLKNKEDALIGDFEMEFPALSEIESLLAEDALDTQGSTDEDYLEKIKEFKLAKKVEEVAGAHEEEFLLKELFLSSNEAASDKVDLSKENRKRELELQR